MQPDSPTLDAVRQQFSAFRLNANAAWNLVEETRHAGASDLAGALAFLGTQRAYAGDDPTTKLNLLHTNLRESITAGLKVAQVLGIDLAEAGGDGRSSR